MTMLLETSEKAFFAWRQFHVSRRGLLLNMVAHKLRVSAAELAGIMADEMGKPVTQGRAEIEKCATSLEYFARIAPLALEDAHRPSTLAKSFVRYEPLGTILAIMPWNFPFWQFFRMCGPALMAGNSIILKHSQVTLRCAKRIEEIFASVGDMPVGLVQWADINHDEVETLVASDSVKAVAFTGSTRAGREIAALTGRHLKKIVLELGGSDPFIVLEDAPVGEVAHKAAIARCQNSGQSCIAAKRFIVHHGLINDFMDTFVDEMSSLIVGDPNHVDTEIGPLATRDQQKLVHELVADAQQKGAKTWCGGVLPKDSTSNFYPPTILSNITPAMRTYHEEMFGPVAQVYSFTTVEEAITIANDTSFGLSSSIWTRNNDAAIAMIPMLECGSVFINTIPFSDPAMPFGGVKQSGYGRELGKEGLLEFVNIKTVGIGE